VSFRQTCVIEKISVTAGQKPPLPSGLIPQKGF